MRNIWKKSILGCGLLFLLLICNGLQAQISLTATAGTLTGSYADLSSAFAAINAGTHQGAITVNITASYTEPGTAVLNSSGAGVALYTGLIIRPSVDGVVVSGASNIGRGLIELNGADNVAINGDNPNTVGINRNLTFTNTASNTFSYTSVIRVALSTVVTSADNVSVLNCILNGSGTGLNNPGASTTSGPEFTTYGILVGGGASTVSATTAPSPIAALTTVVGAGSTALTFTASNNQVDACARGIAVQGSSNSVATGLSITNNLIGAATAGNATTVYARGILASGFSNAVISGNTVRNMSCFVISQIAAISIAEVAAVGNGCVVERNIVTGIFNASTSTFGAYGINIGGGTNHIVRTNSVADITHDMSGGSASSTTFGIFGIRIAGGTGHQVYHNSVNLFGLRPGTPNSNLLSAACCIVNTGTTLLDIRNNIFANTMSGGSTGILNAALYLPSGGTSAMNLNLNNNAYYCGTNSSTDGIAQVSAFASSVNLYLPGNFIPGSIAPSTNLRSYTSTLSPSGTNDALSYGSSNAAPFLSATNLHLNPAALEIANVEQKGVAGLTGVATDIDGDVRPDLGTTLPDLGCDEIVVAACSAANGGTISPSTGSRCIGQTITLTSTGMTVGTGISYQWKFSTVNGGPYANVVGGSGATTPSYTTPALPAGTYYYVLETTCTIGPLSGLSNAFTLVVNPLPNIAVNPGTSAYCAPGGAPVILTASGGSNYAWSPATGLSATTGSTVTANPSVTTSYTVTGTDVNGCIANALATVNVATAVAATATAVPATICLNDSAVLNGGASLIASSYCLPITDCTFPDVITQVSIGTLSRGSSCDGATTDGHSFFALPNPVFIAGNSYPLSVTTDGDTEGAAAWIDYDHDGVFEVGEQILNGYLGVVPATYTSTVLIPLTALNGPTRMRVRCVYGVNPNTLLDPACTDFGFGETEDYTVTITGGVNPFTFLWSPATFLNSTTTATVAAQGVTATTTYLLTATTNEGCTDTANVTVALNTSPPSAICNSLPITVALDSNGLAIINASAIDSGSTDACGIATMSLSISSFDCSDLGSATTTLVVTNVNGSSSTCTAPLMVVDSLVPTISCPGNIALAANLCAGAVATWSAPTIWDNCVPIVSSSAQPGDTFAVGNTTVTYSVADSAGNQATCSFNVVVNFAALTSNVSATPSAICVGDSSLLSANALGGLGLLTYVWSNGAGSGDPITVAPTANTTYTVTVTDACGNTLIDITLLNVTPDPIASFTAVDNQNGSVTFTNASSNGTTYVWDFGNGQVGTQSAPSFTIPYPIAGNYTVVLIVTNACGSDTSTQQIGVVTGLLAGQPTLRSSVYPNPNGGVFVLLLEGMAGENVSVSITDLRGIEILVRGVPVAADLHREIVDICGFSKGVYFLRVQGAGWMSVHRVVVE